MSYISHSVDMFGRDCFTAIMERRNDYSVSVVLRVRVRGLKNKTTLYLDKLYKPQGWCAQSYRVHLLKKPNHSQQLKSDVRNVCDNIQLLFDWTYLLCRETKVLMGWLGSRGVQVIRYRALVPDSHNCNVKWQPIYITSVGLITFTLCSV